MKKRKIARRPEYELAVANIGEEYARARQFIAGAEWSISRSPESDGVCIPEIDVWQASLSGPGFPSHYIYYTFDDTTVRFLAIQRRDKEEKRPYGHTLRYFAHDARYHAQHFDVARVNRLH